MQTPKTALAGLGLWLISWAWLRPEPTVTLLLVGPFVAVPLALALVAPPRPGPAWSRGWAAMQWLALPTAALAAASFAYPAGRLAAGLTLPWLGFAGLLAACALVRAVSHRLRPFGELAIDAGMAVVAVGAFWLTVSRSGMAFLGFGDPIALLTAAHFNLAGIAVPVLAGLAARRMPGRFATVTAFGAVSGLPAVAAGITLQAQGVRHVNAIAVSYFVAAMVLLSIQHARLAARHGPSGARWLWGVAAASLPVGMALALLYATAEYTGLVLTIDTMVRTHAVVNVFGFALPALAAWHVAGPRPPSPAPASPARPAPSP